VARGLSLDGVLWAFGLHGHAANWHPLAWLGHMLDTTLFEQSVGAHKAMNVLYHVAATVLLFVALRLMTRQNAPSALAAGLFGVHPLRAESVAWVAERKDVLCALFWMATLVAWAVYARRPDGRRYATVLVCFGLALLAKGMAVTLPLVLLLLDVWPLDRRRGENAAPWRRLLLEKAPLLAMSLCAGAFTLVAQARGSALASFESIGLAQRLANALESLTAYVAMWVWPAKLGMYYPHRYPTPETLDTAAEWLPALASFGILVAASAGAVALRRRQPALLVGWLWYGIVLAPVLGLVQVGSQGMADRYTYLPCVGLGIAAAFPLWQAVAASAPGRLAYALGAAALVVLVYGALTVDQVRAWTSNSRICARSLAAAEARGLPADGFMERQLALSYLDEVRKVERIRTDDPARRAEALAAARRAVELRPGDPAAHQTFAAAAILAGDYERALGAARRAIARADALGHRDDLAMARFTEGLALLRLHRDGEAREAIEKSLASSLYAPVAREARSVLDGLPTGTEESE
jgi:tetratricopeptide (TPR) repeat protein